MFKNWLKKHHIYLILGIGGVVFFILFSYLNFSAPLRFNSPDETANFFFTRQLAEQGQIWYFEQANYYLDGLVHPRSIEVIDNFLVPGGFLGLIVIFGYIGKIIGASLTIYLTPLVAVLAGWAWYGIVKKYFSKWVGVVSCFLVWLYPSWWYYTARSMFPNVFFVSLLMIGAYFALVRPFRERGKRLKLAKGWFGQNLDFWLGAFFMGLAVFVRPAEIFWVGAAILLVILLNARKIDWLALLLFFAVAAIALGPMLFLNNSIYGSPFRTGYQGVVDKSMGVSPAEDIETGVTTSEVVSVQPWHKALKNYLPYVLPFGFKAENVYKNFFNYHLYFNWWYTLFWVGGLIYMLVLLFGKKLKSYQMQYILIFALISFWLVVVYGSWNFHDNIDPSKITIGNSYLRYWLPSFVLATPFIGVVVMALNKFLKVLPLKIIWLSFFLTFFCFFGAWTCIYGEDEGLVYVRRHLLRYESIANRVFEITEDNALIITDRSDKIFFPRRRIVYPLQNQSTYDALPKMYFAAPLYYYGITFPEPNLDYLNESVFSSKKMRLRRLESFNNESLYIFDYIKDESST